MGEETECKNMPEEKILDVGNNLKSIKNRPIPSNQYLPRNQNNNSHLPRDQNNNSYQPQDQSISNEIKPYYSKKPLFLWYFAISIAVLLYDLFNYCSFYPKNFKIHSNIDGDETFNYLIDPQCISMFFLNTIFGFLLLIILWGRAVLNMFVDWLISNEILKRTLKLVTGFSVIISLWSLIGAFSASGRIFGTRVFVFFLIFTNTFFTVKSWKVKTVLTLILIFFAINALRTTGMPQEMNISNYFNANSINGEKYLSFIEECNFEVKNVNIVESNITAFAYSLYMPGIFKSISIGTGLLNEKLFEAFKGIFLHELGHIIYYHSLVHFFIILVFFGVLLPFANRFFKGIEMEKIIYGLCLVSIADKFFLLISNVVSQYMEYQADNFIKINDQSLIIPSMYTLVKSHSDKSKNLIFGFFYPMLSPNFTHPSTFHRIKALGIEIQNNLIDLKN